MASALKISLIVIGLILLLSAIGVGVYFGFIKQSAVMPTTYKGFTQYEGTACGTYQCDYIYGKLLTSGTAEFNTGYSQWKIVSGGGSWGSCGADSQGYIVGGCCTTTEVYKNGVLIDTIKQGYGGTSSSQNTPYQTRVYCEDGTYDTCPDSIGIGVYPRTWGSTYGIGECNNRQNEFTIIIPNGTFAIDTVPSKTAYSFGETILFTIKVNNNLFDTKGKIKIYYEAPSIFGKVTKTEEKDVDLLQGENYFNFTLPINEPTSSVTIKPELIVYYKTSEVQGVNYNFGNGKLEPINAYPYFDLTTFQDVPINLNITAGSGDISCEDVGCPTGYNCSDNGMCEKPSYLIWIIISIVLSLIVIVLIVLLTRRRRRK